MKKYDRYAETRGVQNLGSKMEEDMDKKYGKEKYPDPFINRKLGKDEFNKNHSIAYEDSPD